jgi:protein-S-isoprenylcysteine O-methyltransferase Ste14
MLRHTRARMARIAAFCLVGLFLVAERALRRDQAAISIEVTPDDHGTTRLIGAAYGVALILGILAPLLSRLELRTVRPSWLSRLGLLLMVGGIGLRIWAAVTLGRFYTRTLRTSADQTVVRAGPYAAIRHPGYLADLIMWLGFGLCSESWIVIASICSAMGFAYARRIDAEEKMLRANLGEAYETYAMNTARLVPRVY